MIQYTCLLLNENISDLIKTIDLYHVNWFRRQKCLIIVWKKVWHSAQYSTGITTHKLHMQSFICKPCGKVVFCLFDKLLHTQFNYTCPLWNSYRSVLKHTLKTILINFIIIYLNLGNIKVEFLWFINIKFFE